MKKIWILSLCALLVLSVEIGLSVPLRIAIGANAMLILVDVAKRVWRYKDGSKEEN